MTAWDRRHIDRCKRACERFEPPGACIYYTEAERRGYDMAVWVKPVWRGYSTPWLFHDGQKVTTR